MTYRENMEAMFNHEPMDNTINVWKDCFVMRDSCVERPMGCEGYDTWGTHWIPCPETANITHPDTYDIKFTEISEWKDKVHIPVIEDIDFSEADEMYSKYTDELKKEKMCYLISLNGIFERSHILMGFEAALTEFLTEPEEFGKMLEAFADHKIRSLGYFCDHYHPDIILYQDDLGTQLNQFLPTEYYSKYLFPQYKRIVDALKAKGTKYVVHHSCGKIDGFIEEWKMCGFDGLDSLMPCNDLKYIVDTLGKDYVLWPGGDNQDILGVAGIPKAKIEQMVVDYFNLFGRDGTGFAMDTSFALCLNKENADYCYEMELKHGKKFMQAKAAGLEYNPKIE